MISNKLNGEEISPNDIKLDLKEETKQSMKTQNEKKKFENQKNKQLELENTRDFNSLPRNYNSS